MKTFRSTVPAIWQLGPPPTEQFVFKVVSAPAREDGENAR
jgi:hypothetical protein